MDKWTRQYPELHPDQPLVTRLNNKVGIYSPQVEVKDSEGTDCFLSTQEHGAQSAVVNKAPKSVINEPYSYVQIINGIQMIVNSYVLKESGIPMSFYSCGQITTNK